MSTKVLKVEGGYLVSQFRGPTKERRTWSKPVFVPKGDRSKVLEELMRQAEESRAIAGVHRLQ